MPFILKRYSVNKPQKVQIFLLNEVGMDMKTAQKSIAKRRILDDKGVVVNNSQILRGGFVDIFVFEGNTRGLKPIFDTDDFAIFNKPSGLLVHPTSRMSEYTLLDEVHYHFGENASLVHRIDKETSGLVLVAKNKDTDKVLKSMFENRQFVKKYLAIVKGEIKKPIKINSDISKDKGLIGVKMTTNNQNGKKSLTFISPLKYNKENNTTLIEAIPHTGRQHQIRVHLFSINHSILGDPIYGVDDKIANDYLLKNLSNKDRLKYTGANRLMLHAYSISFVYKDTPYSVAIKDF